MELILTHDEIVEMSDSVVEGVRLLNDRLEKEGFDLEGVIKVTEDFENQTFTYSQSH